MAITAAAFTTGPWRDRPYLSFQEVAPRGGEFYTPISIVRLLVEVLEPFHGRILDPACGSGGMFVQSARFVAEHKHSPAAELAIHGQEKVADTVKLCRMNLAIHGLEGDIREGISYYDDLHNATGDSLRSPRPSDLLACQFASRREDHGQGVYNNVRLDRH